MNQYPWEGLPDAAYIPGTAEDHAHSGVSSTSRYDYVAPPEHIKQREAATEHEMFPNRFDKPGTAYNSEDDDYR